MLKKIRLRIISLLFMDFVTLLLLFLMLTYHGVQHIFLIFMGAVLFVLGLYDLKTGLLSLVLLEIFKMPVGQMARGGPLNIVPLGMSVFVAFFGIAGLFEHGLVNIGQANMMTGYIFMQFAVWFIAIGTVIMLVAIGTHILSSD